VRFFEAAIVILTQLAASPWYVRTVALSAAVVGSATVTVLLLTYRPGRGR
jgi:hypothetical protein